jgi:hypothetical protein
MDIIFKGQPFGEGWGRKVNRRRSEPKKAEDSAYACRQTKSLPNRDSWPNESPAGWVESSLTFSISEVH